MRFKACLLGAPLDTGNMGVTALGNSLVSLILRQIPDAEISFFVGNRSDRPYSVEVDGRPVSVRVINHRMSPKSRIGEHLLGLLLMAGIFRIAPTRAARDWILERNPRLKALSEADFIGNIHGGDSFSDIYGIRWMVHGILPDLIVILLRKPLVLLPQTYGPYTSGAARGVAKFLLKRAACILTRDREGLSIVEELLGSEKTKTRPRFCPDVAFSLAPKTTADVPVAPPLPASKGNPVFGFNVSGLLYNGGFTKDNMFGLSFDYRHFVRALAEKILSGTDVHLLLVPHTFAPKGHVESDPEACEDLFRFLVSRYPDRVHVVNRECGPSEIKGVVGLCDFFVGSRMHACIGALSQGIPTVGVAYSRKFQGVFESVGVGHLVVDARRGNEEQAIEAVLSVYRRRTEEKRIIRERVGPARELIGQTFCELLGGPLQDETAAGVPGTRSNMDLPELERAGTVARD